MTYLSSVSIVNFEYVIAHMVITWVPIHCSSVICLSFEFFDKHGSKGKLFSRSTTPWKLNDQKNDYMYQKIKLSIKKFFSKRKLIRSYFPRNIFSRRKTWFYFIFRPKPATLQKVKLHGCLGLRSPQLFFRR